VCYFSQVEPKKVEEALQDESWINVMHEELNRFTRNDVWELVPQLDIHDIIETKWIFKNKSNEHRIVIINKARLVAQGYS
jgi:hypothetical protein